MLRLFSFRPLSLVLLGESQGLLGPARRLGLSSVLLIFLFDSPWCLRPVSYVQNTSQGRRPGGIQTRCPRHLYSSGSFRSGVKYIVPWLTDLSTLYLRKLCFINMLEPSCNFKVQIDEASWMTGETFQRAYGSRGHLSTLK